ncbi:hypothetical protein SETIT_7G271900v2 [Setaria italica]|uniref:Uncharacterized protein n=1 Tax=Setaria italica TaxID=4555 RepID=A0A368S047_SETIT|nr:hypothetical protein SETIT_7G271900v2 [Setaria italica]
MAAVETTSERIAKVACRAVPRAVLVYVRARVHGLIDAVVVAASSQPGDDAVAVAYRHTRAGLATAMQRRDADTNTIACTTPSSSAVQPSVGLCRKRRVCPSLDSTDLTPVACVCCGPTDRPSLQQAKPHLRVGGCLREKASIGHAIFSSHVTWNTHEPPIQGETTEKRGQPTGRVSVGYATVDGNGTHLLHPFWDGRAAGRGPR